MTTTEDKHTTTLHETTGRVPSVLELPGRVDEAVLAGLREVADLAGTVSDALDDLGIAACVGSGVLRPSIPGTTIVGTAITVHNVPRSEGPLVYAQRRDVRMEELEGINQGEPGDVLVIQGIPGASNMGGMMSTIAHRQQLAGSIVDGGVRDVGQARSLRYPLWSTEVTPVTGKWRAETIEVNGEVVVCGMRVRAGDVVVADETGVCFIPLDLAPEVLRRAREFAEKERRYHADIAAGLSVPELAAKYKPPRPS